MFDLILGFVNGDKSSSDTLLQDLGFCRYPSTKKRHMKKSPLNDLDGEICDQPLNT